MSTTIGFGKHDRPVLALELDARLVRPSGTIAPASSRPFQTKTTGPRRVARAPAQVPDDVAVAVDDLDVDSVGFRGAGTRSPPRPCRTRRRARRPSSTVVPRIGLGVELQRLRVREGERRGSEQRRDEGGWRVSGHGRRCRWSARPPRDKPGHHRARRGAYFAPQLKRRADPYRDDAGDRRPCTADEPGGRRRRRARRGPHRVVAAARAARAPARARAHPRPPLVPRLRLLLRGAAAAVRRRAARGQPPAAVREHGRASGSSPPPRSPTSPAGRRSASFSAGSSRRLRSSLR